MTTLRTAISVFLENPTLFTNNHEHISMMNHEKLALMGYESKVFLNYTEAKASIGKNATFYSITRHPLDRFLSGYLDKCLV